MNHCESGKLRLLVWAALIGLAITARTVPAEDNVLGFSPAALKNGGTLVICGGGEAPDEIYDEFVRLAGGKRARIVLIPSAFPYDSREEVEERFLGWKQYRLASFHILDAASRDEADDPEFLKPLERATGVWFSGGDQNRLSELYNGTKTELALRHALDRGGVIGGTSAGASFMSQVMIAYGSADDTAITDGLGLVQRAVIDQHFTQRGRHTRLLHVLDKHPQLIGIGVDEGTAVVVAGNHLRAMGDSRVTIFLTPDEDEAIKIYRLKDEEEARLVTLANDVDNGTPRIELRKLKPPPKP